MLWHPDKFTGGTSSMRWVTVAVTVTGTGTGTVTASVAVTVVTVTVTATASHGQEAPTRGIAHIQQPT
eukprot:3988659-Pyramimonas_sp.AAC.1